MVSIKGLGADGNQFNWTAANVRVSKIMTPTHYMLIQHIVRNDSVIFNDAHAGPIRIEGNKYSHTQTLGFNAATIGTNSDYAWRLEGNQLVQAGTITTKDGEKTAVDELVYRRVSSPLRMSKIRLSEHGISYHPNTHGLMEQKVCTPVRQ